jgi:hypothetical protein
LFRDSTETEDLTALAMREDGRLKRLSREQRRQIWEDATFTVPSVAYPDQAHVWRLNGLIQLGTRPTLNAMKEWLGRGAVTLFFCLIPMWLWRDFGVVNGTKQILLGVRNLLSLFWGLWETRCKHDVWSRIQLCEDRFVLGAFFGEGKPSPPKEMPDVLEKDGIRVDMRVHKLKREIERELERIETQLNEVWTNGKYKFIRNLMSGGGDTIAATGSEQTKEHEIQVATACAHEYNR